MRVPAALVWRGAYYRGCFVAPASDGQPWKTVFSHWHVNHEKLSTHIDLSTMKNCLLTLTCQQWKTVYSPWHNLEMKYCVKICSFDWASPIHVSIFGMVCQGSYVTYLHVLFTQFSFIIAQRNYCYYIFNCRN